MLTGAKVVADETVVPKAIVTAIQTAASAAVKSMAAGDTAREEQRPKGPSLPPPTLLRVVQKDGAFMLRGMPAVDPDGVTLQPINVTVTEAATAAGAPK